MDISPTYGAVLEAYLFYEGGEAKKSTLQKTLSWNDETLAKAVEELHDALQNRGLTLLIIDDTLSLKTAPLCAEVVKLLDKDIRERDLGQAGLEVLGILLYRGPSSKADIDFVRGVNSGSTLRHLELRGLIERTKREGERGIVYATSTDTLGMLGIHDKNELPEWGSIASAITALEETKTISTL